MNPEISITCKAFHDLNVEELYFAVQLRLEVFVMEQKCIYQDLDDKDQDSFHLFLYKNGVLMAYARLLPKGLSYQEYASIGRVVSRKENRREGFGFLLVEEAMKKCEELFPNTSIKISAQEYLLNFYQKFGFKAIGETYLEDGLPHCAMILEK